MSRKNDSTTGKLLENICIIKIILKLIGIDLSRQTSMSIPQQISFVGKSEEDDGATILFF